MFFRLVIGWALFTVSAQLVVFGGWADELRILGRIDAVGGRSLLSERDADICGIGCLEGRSFLIEALSARPGLSVRQAGRFGGTASVRVRGAPYGHTLVLIDGVPANDASTPAGGFDFARIGGSDIARVEVYKGSDALMWGAGAGAINIVSVRPESGGRIAGQFHAGGYDTRAGSLGLSGGNRRVSGHLSVDGLTTAGISKAANGSESDGFSRLGVSAFWQYSVSENADMRGGLRYGLAEVAYDGFDPVAPGFVSDADRRGSSRDIAAHAGLSWLVGPVSSDLLIAATRVERRDYAGVVESFSARADGIFLRYHADVVYGSGHRWLAGTSWYRSNALDEQADRFGVFGIHELSLESTRIGIGLRGDTDIHGVRSGVSADIVHSIGSSTVLRAGWSSGYVAPTPYQRTAFFAPATAAAGSDLGVEASRNWSIGVSWRSRSVSLRATGFGRSAESQIAYRGGRYVNLDSSESSGVEFSAAIDVTDVVSVEGWLTVFGAVENGLGATDLPELSAGVDMSFSYSEFSARVSARHVGSHRQFAGSVSAWTRFDVLAQFRMSEQVRIYARIENLFDIRYQEVIGYGTPGFRAEFGIGLSAG